MAMQGFPPRLLALSERCPHAMQQREHWHIKDFALVREVGSGAASVVYYGVCRKSCLPCAIKVYHKHKLTRLNRHQVDREINIHSSHSHPNIVDFYAAFEDDDRVYLVQEYASGGDLFDEVKRRGGRLPEMQVVQGVLYPYLCALAYLHSRGVAHRDVKPENTVFTRTRVMKITDFGLAVDMNQERPVTRLGTLDYMSPEVLRCPDKHQPEDNKDRVDLAYGTAVDAWAMGVLAYELIIGRPPFGMSSREDTMKSIVSGSPVIPEWMSAGAADFITSSLAKDARNRPTIAQLLVHPWITSIVRGSINVCSRPSLVSHALPPAFSTPHLHPAPKPAAQLTHSHSTTTTHNSSMAAAAAAAAPTIAAAGTAGSSSNSPVLTTQASPALACGYKLGLVHSNSQHVPASAATSALVNVGQNNTDGGSNALHSSLLGNNNALRPATDGSLVTRPQSLVRELQPGSISTRTRLPSQSGSPSQDVSEEVALLGQEGDGREQGGARQQEGKPEPSPGRSQMHQPAHVLMCNPGATGLQQQQQQQQQQQGSSILPHATTPHTKPHTLLKLGSGTNSNSCSNLLGLRTPSATDQVPATLARLHSHGLLPQALAASQHKPPLSPQPHQQLPRSQYHMHAQVERSGSSGSSLGGVSGGSAGASDHLRLSGQQVASHAPEGVLALRVIEEGGAAKPSDSCNQDFSQVLLSPPSSRDNSAKLPTFAQTPATPSTTCMPLSSAPHVLGLQVPNSQASLKMDSPSLQQQQQQQQGRLLRHQRQLSLQSLQQCAQQHQQQQQLSPSHIVFLQQQQQDQQGQQEQQALLRQVTHQMQTQIDEQQQQQLLKQYNRQVHSQLLHEQQQQQQQQHINQQRHAQLQQHSLARQQQQQQQQQQQAQLQYQDCLFLGQQQQQGQFQRQQQWELPSVFAEYGPPKSHSSAQCILPDLDPSQALEDRDPPMLPSKSINALSTTPFNTQLRGVDGLSLASQHHQHQQLALRARLAQLESLHGAGRNTGGCVHLEQQQQQQQLQQLQQQQQQLSMLAASQGLLISDVVPTTTPYITTTAPSTPCVLSHPAPTMPTHSYPLVPMQVPLLDGSPTAADAHRLQHHLLLQQQTQQQQQQQQQQQGLSLLVHPTHPMRHHSQQLLVDSNSTPVLLATLPIQSVPPTAVPAPKPQPHIASAPLPRLFLPSSGGPPACLNSKAPSLCNSGSQHPQPPPLSGPLLAPSHSPQLRAPQPHMHSTTVPPATEPVSPLPQREATQPVAPTSPIPPACSSLSKPIGGLGAGAALASQEHHRLPQRTQLPQAVSPDLHGVHSSSSRSSSSSSGVVAKAGEGGSCARGGSRLSRNLVAHDVPVEATDGDAGSGTLNLHLSHLSADLAVLLDGSSARNSPALLDQLPLHLQEQLHLRHSTPPAPLQQLLLHANTQLIGLPHSLSAGAEGTCTASTSSAGAGAAAPTSMSASTSGFPISPAAPPQALSLKHARSAAYSVPEGCCVGSEGKGEGCVSMGGANAVSSGKVSSPSPVLTRAAMVAAVAAQSSPEQGSACKRQALSFEDIKRQ